MDKKQQPNQPISNPLPPRYWTAEQRREAFLRWKAEAWPWSSAGAHCGLDVWREFLDLRMWSERWDARSWKDYLSVGQQDAELRQIRQATHTGRPLGDTDFVQQLEEKMNRPLAPRPGGRPAKSEDEARQDSLPFE